MRVSASRMSTTLIDPQDASDAGGVAGRRGFRFQDHVGAGFVISMLADPELVQVEFETGDDIVLRWLAGGQDLFEYVQVKTTENDAKWSCQELFARDKKRPGTSIAEKSLYCDRHGGSASFRIVSVRDVRKELRPFCVERGKRRTVKPELDKLVDKFANKYKTARSPSGRTLRDWASSLFWKVEPDKDTLQAVNVNRLIQQAGDAGETPSHPQAVAIYIELLGMVADAADASRIFDPDAKALTRDGILSWWRAKLNHIRISNRGSLKVYRVSSHAFFSDLHHIDDSHIRRSLRAYDVEFDDRTWRSEELIEYLLNWLPEIALPAKVLAEFDHLNARELTRKAVAAFEERGTVTDEQLMAELLLHSVLRHYFDSEPIACKIFYGRGTTRGTTSAHIVPSLQGDQLWVGRARLTTASTYDAILGAVIADLEVAVSRDIMRAERNLIVSLREPHHMRGSTLEKTLSPSGKTEDLLRCLHLPIMVAYDSRVIAAGFAEDYVDQLRDEAAEKYNELKARLPASLASLQVHVFLIPIENPAALAPLFGRRLRGE